MLAIHQYKSLESTNAEALCLWDELIRTGGSPKPFLVLADEQTGARGRLGRSWPSPIGGISMSLVWPLVHPPAHYRGVSLVAARAVSKGLETACHLNTGIKWPGDVCVGERKVAGVFGEMHSDRVPPMVILGVGINGNYPAADIHEDERVNQQTTLQDELGEPADLKNVLFEVSTALEEDLGLFDKEGLTPVLPRIEMRLMWLHKEVACIGPGDRRVEGYLAGLDESGQALLEVDGGVEAVTAGDLARIRRG